VIAIGKTDRFVMSKEEYIKNFPHDDMIMKRIGRVGKGKPVFI
jgi:hypothetical protein